MFAKWTPSYSPVPQGTARLGQRGGGPHVRRTRLTRRRRLCRRPDCQHCYLKQQNPCYRERMTPPYHPPVKRSVEIAGHKTSISLEPLFWDMLRDAAVGEGVPVNALVARIDAERIRSDTPPGLAGAVRIWLVSKLAADAPN